MSQIQQPTQQQLFNLVCEKYQQDLLKQTESGVHTNFTEDHRELNRQVFSMLLDLVPFPDIHLQSHCDLVYRFLIARKWDVVVTVESMREYFGWRKKEKIDTVLWERFDQELMDFGPVFRGFSRQGYPITWQKPDPSKISALLAKYDQETLMRRNWVALEQARRLMAATGADRMVAVWDLEKLGLAIAMNPSAISFLKVMSKETQKYYPELLRTMLLANGGRVVSMVWKMIAPFLDERVQKKICDVGTGAEKMAEALSQWVDLSEVSPAYGGTGPESAEMDPVLKECSNDQVPSNTPPLRKSNGARTEVIFVPPPPPPLPPIQQQENQNTKRDDENDEGDESENNNQHRPSSCQSDLESADSGDIDPADLIISSPSENYQRRNNNNNINGDGDDDELTAYYNQQRHITFADVSSNTNTNGTNANSSASAPKNSPSTTSTAISNQQQQQQQVPSALPSVSFVPKLPPRCVHLFVRLQTQPFPELIVASRTELVQLGANNNNSKIIRKYADIASQFPPGDTIFTTIGMKVMGSKKSTGSSSSSSSSAAIPSSASHGLVHAETVLESGHLLRNNLILLDEKQRVHFVLEKGAIRNEIRLFRPASSLLSVVEKKKSMQFHATDERALIAKIFPIPNNGWFVLRDEDSIKNIIKNKAANNSNTNQENSDYDEIKKTAMNAVLTNAHHDFVLARCVDFPIFDFPQLVCGDLFQFPENYKVPRGNNYHPKEKTVIGFHRVASFEQELISAPAAVLAAFVSAVDACCLANFSQ